MTSSFKQKLFSKFTFLLLIILFSHLTVDAKKVEGYIITENSDTIYGEVKVYGYNINTGTFILKGIDLEWFHQEIRFRKYNGGGFKQYLPDMISGFGFYHNSIHYIFQSFELEKYSITEGNIKYRRFLTLLVDGEISLYRDINRIPPFDYSRTAYNQPISSTYVYYNYYLNDARNGLMKAEKDQDIKTVHELLRLYKVDEKFIMILPKKADFKDIKAILINYRIWITNQKLKQKNI